MADLVSELAAFAAERGAVTARMVAREAPRRDLRRRAAELLAAAEAAGMLERVVGVRIDGRRARVAWRATQACDTLQPVGRATLSGACDTLLSEACDTLQACDTSQPKACDTSRACDTSQDAGRMLELLQRRGPMTYGAAATAMGLGATAAWRAADELTARALVTVGHLGQLEAGSGPNAGTSRGATARGGECSLRSPEKFRGKC